MKLIVRQMMDTSAHAVSADLPIREAIDLLIKKGVTGIPVTNAAGKVLGAMPVI